MRMYMLSNRDRIVSDTYDASLMWVSLILLGLGLVMMYSASIAMAEADKMTGHQPAYFLVRHSIYLLIRLIAAVTAFKVPVPQWQTQAHYPFIGGVGLLSRGRFPA